MKPTKAYQFTFLQASVSIAMKRWLMHKYFGAAIVRGDESVPFAGVEPLASASDFSHGSKAALIL